MAYQFKTWQEAVDKARALKAEGVYKPAAVEINPRDGDLKEFWAVKDSDDLDTVSGFVESIEIF